LLETLLPCLSGILRIDIAQEPDVEGLPLRRMEDRVGITVEVAEPDAIQPHLASSTSRIELLKENVTALQNAGYDVAAFTDSMTAMDALLTSSPIELLITRVRFPDNTPNGVALGRMARIKRPGVNAGAKMHRRAGVIMHRNERTEARTREASGRLRYAEEACCAAVSARLA
jgi:hypothetical protein